MSWGKITKLGVAAALGALAVGSVAMADPVEVGVAFVDPSYEHDAIDAQVVWMDEVGDEFEVYAVRNAGSDVAEVRITKVCSTDLGLVYYSEGCPIATGPGTLSQGSDGSTIISADLGCGSVHVALDAVGDEYVTGSTVGATHSGEYGIKASNTWGRDATLAGEPTACDLNFDELEFVSASTGRSDGRIVAMVYPDEV